MLCIPPSPDPKSCRPLWRSVEGSELQAFRHVASSSSDHSWTSPSVSVNFPAYLDPPRENAPQPFKGNDQNTKRPTA